MNKSLTSRSAVLTYQTCPRKRFLAYHYNNHGLESGFLNIDLAVGTSIHRGLQHLLEHCRLHHADGNFEQKCIDEAVEHARKLWLKMCSDYTIRPKGLEEVDYIIFEQMSLIEALIRSFAAFRLSTFLEEYEVLEVEKEEVYEDFSETVTWLGKADGLLRNKLTNELVVLSIKTASGYYDSTMRYNLHDMQGVSEIACIQDRLLKLQNRINDFETKSLSGESYLADIFIEETEIRKLACDNLLQYLSDLKDDVKISKVQYEYLVKGQRKKDSDGCYKQDSILIRPYKQDSLMFLTMDFDEGTNLEAAASEYKWKMGQGKTPKNWSRINIWEDMGVDNWIQFLVEGKCQPEEGNPFQNFIITPEIVNRTEDEIEEWKTSTSFLEESVAERLDLLGLYKSKANFDDKLFGGEKEELYKEYDKLLLRFFPKNTQSCHNFYGNDCIFVNICHNGLNPQDGLDSGLFQIRKPHHKLEEDKFRKEGFVK